MTRDIARVRLHLHAIDLHCHSSCSDGALTPDALIERAHARGVRVIALTDHDTLCGLSAAADKARSCGLSFVPGVEISVSWGGVDLHVLGLNIDPTDAALVAGLAGLRGARLRRAQDMASRLDRHGIPDALNGALALAAHPESVGRLHFAHYLVARGLCKDVKAAFRAYLGEGRAAYVRQRWASLDAAVSWIRHAGGMAVLAHPLRYGLRPRRLRALLEELKALGGAGVEVVTASQGADEVARLSALCRQLDLCASAGSDFHAPDSSWLDIGETGALPADVRPLWGDWPQWPSTRQ